MPSEQTFISTNSKEKPSENTSTMPDENSYCTVDPIHSGSQSFLSSSKNKNYPIKPAFGTRAERQIHQLKGNKQSQIVAYSRINYEKNQKYYDRYEQIKAKLTPFMSASGRFGKNKVQNPGPGNYSFPQIFKTKEQTKKQQGGAMFCPFKRQQNKQNKIHKIKNVQETPHVFWQNKQNYTKSFELQQRIKEKREQIKQRMATLKQKMKKPQQNFRPILKRMGYSEEDDKKTEIVQSSNKKSTEERSYPKSLNLKQITNKYLPKMEFAFEREEYRTGAVVKNFKEKYNNQPMFITKNQALFSSYITKNQSPGPGYYEQKTKKPRRRQSSSKIQKFLL